MWSRGRRTEEHSFEPRLHCVGLLLGGRLRRSQAQLLAPTTLPRPPLAAPSSRCDKTPDMSNGWLLAASTIQRGSCFACPASLPIFACEGSFCLWRYAPLPVPPRSCGNSQALSSTSCCLTIAFAASQHGSFRQVSCAMIQARLLLCSCSAPRTLRDRPCPCLPGANRARAAPPL